MAKKCFLSVLLLQLHLFEIHSYLVQEPLANRMLDLMKHIQYPYGQECLQIVVNTTYGTRTALITPNNVPVRVWSYTALQFRDIRIDHEAQCETFLIFANNIENVERILRLERGSVKQFFPFTKIFLHFENRFNYTTHPIFISAIRKFLIENALFGYVLEFDGRDYESMVVVKDLLVNDDLRNKPLSFVPKQLLHPAVDTNQQKENFRISLFNCMPYTIYPQLNEKNETFINKMDGTEFRFVQEVTKNWNKTFKFRDFSLVKYNPYVAILDDLASRDSDMSMCALWLIEDTYKRCDLSTFYEDQCLVLLVPKPMKLNEATAIYTTLHTYVWLLVLFFFLWYIVSLNAVAKIESELNGSTSAFVNFAVTVMETISAATSHSVTRFPNDQLSVKIILMSWILLSLWLGICYTTIYASRLAKPSYAKPINTIRQVVDNDLYICNAYFDESTMIPLRESANADHRELGNRSIVYGENEKYRRQLIVERKCAIFEARITEHYISLRKFENDLDLLPIYRTFKKCITNHFTGFAFQKYSPYTKLFNYHIRRYQEHGIIRKWESDILQTPQEMKTLFDDYPEHTNSLHSITIINVSGAFFLLGVGLSCSAIIFFVEFVKCRHTVKNVIYNFNLMGRIKAKFMSKIMK